LTLKSVPCSRPIFHEKFVTADRSDEQEYSHGAVVEFIISRFIILPV